MRVWASKTTEDTSKELCANESPEIPSGERPAQQRLHHDEHGFIGPMLMVIPYLLLLIGAAMMAGGAIAGGLMVSGLGVLIVGAPGSGSIATGMFRVTGPAGLIMIALGVVIAISL